LPLGRLVVHFLVIIIIVVVIVFRPGRLLELNDAFVGAEARLQLELFVLLFQLLQLLE